MQWEKLILETAQLGGSVVFIDDLASGEVAQWMGIFSRVMDGKVGAVKRSQKDLLSGCFQTRYQDLIVFFPHQLSLLSSLNAVLQGQRLCLSSEPEPVKSVLLDGTWTDCNLTTWQKSLECVAAALKTPSVIPEWSLAHQAPCLFLDRDDVVVKNVPYNKDPALVELLPGIADLINRAHAAGYWVALVTNQSGLGRGWISWAEYQKVHQQMLKLLAEQGCWVDECVWAGFYEKEPAPAGLQFAGLRKPRGGMFQLVNDKLKVTLRQSVMVGDSASDLVAAHGLGLKKLYLLNSDKSAEEKNKLASYQVGDSSLRYSFVSNFSEVEI